MTPDNRVITQTKVEKISAEDAEKYIGKKEMICSMVYNVKELSNINFLDVGANFPSNPLTVVVFSRDKGNFKDGLEVYDKKISVLRELLKNIKASLKSLSRSHRIFL